MVEIELPKNTFIKYFTGALNWVEITNETFWVLFVFFCTSLVLLIYLYVKKCIKFSNYIWVITDKKNKNKNSFNATDDNGKYVKVENENTELKIQTDDEVTKDQSDNETFTIGIDDEVLDKNVKFIQKNPGSEPKKHD